MDPLKAQQLTLGTVDVFLSIEEQILINIAKRLKSGKQLLIDDINSWQLEKLQQLESLTQANVITIAKHSGMAIDEVTAMLEQAGYLAVDENEADLIEAVQKGKLIETVPVAQSVSLQNVIAAYTTQAKDTFNLVNSTMLSQARQVYLDIINQTVGKVLSGVSTPQEALREIASKWAEKGVPALIDKAGRQWSTEAYINAVTRSMSNNIANEMQEARMDEYGADLIEVSSHSGARPGCAPYQGRIFSRSGNHPKYKPLSSTSYGEASGLKGVNCGHLFYPYIEGITDRTYRPVKKAENDKAYAESQAQRKLERDIRKAKRELAMMEAMGDSEGVELAKKKIRDKQANMREFINETGRTRRRNREAVY